jgi:hypothetical protein
VTAEPEPAREEAADDRAGDAAARADADLARPRPLGNEGVELVPGETASHHGPEDERTTHTIPLEDEAGHERVVEQQPVGRQRVEGGGEFPQPAREPVLPAPGAIDADVDADDAAGETDGAADDTNGAQSSS